MIFRTTPADGGWFDQNVPCTRACPVLTTAGRYVSAIAAGDDDLAYLTARLPNPFPSICGRVCAAPCELACRRGVIDEPIAIRALKRFACEHAGVESGEGDRMWRQAVHLMPRRAERVAVIGAGPAGLACAHDLAAFGYQPVVFEAQDRPGGMMVLGIPPYRLRRDILQSEIRAILDLGVELRTGVRLGGDFSLSSLRDDGFEAVFLGTGAFRSRDLSIPGIELDGVLKAVDFLINANLGYRVELGERVLVIGGGNVALDAARSALRELAAGRTPTGRPPRGSGDDVDAAATAAFDAARVALRMGARDVQVVSLESRAEMPAHEYEIEEAEKEGIRFVHRQGPKRIVGEGRVEGLEALRVSSVFDPDGRFNPKFVTGTESVIPCDSVILAIGQAPDLSWLRSDDGVEVTARGTIGVDRETLATSSPGVYSGGDVAFGPRNLIDAIADGRRAAASIHRRLSGERVSAVPVSRVGRTIPLQVINRPILEYDAVPRLEVPAVASERRIGVPEIELGYTAEQARTEAARCLQCFLNISLDVDLCILCGGCVDICPEHCIRIVPMEEITGVVHAETAPASALILQEDRCIRCALCIERCPTDALSMMDWSEASTAEEPALVSVSGGTGNG
jgi:NADPH-dependent glutamate synthase beta subunit-like oxidoreductase